MDILLPEFYSTIDPIMENYEDFNTDNPENWELDQFLIDILYKEVNDFKINVINLICYDIYNLGLLGSNKISINLLPKIIKNNDKKYIIDNIIKYYIDIVKKTYIVTNEDAELFNTVFIYETEEYVIRYLNSLFNNYPKLSEINSILEKRSNKFSLWLLKKHNKLNSLPNEIEKKIKTYI